MSPKVTTNAETGAVTLTLKDRDGWWDDELRHTVRAGGQQEIELISRHEGAPPRSETIVLPEDETAALGAWLLENSRGERKRVTNG